MGTLNIVAIDDHPVYLSGFASILYTLPEIRMVYTYSGYESALLGVKNNQPHIVFLDLKLPGIDGFELCGQLKDIVPDAYIVAHTGYYNQIAQKAFKHGADAYISKEADVNIIENFIEEFSLGIIKYHAIYGNSSEEEIVDGEIPFQMIAKLTPREKQLMNMEAKGMKRSEIMAALSISEHTYKSHIGNIRTKLNLRNISSIISFASRHFPIK